MTTPQTGRIFISYRRDDSAGYAGHIYDRLVERFGKDAIFMDVDKIPAGLDFAEVLENEVKSCDVLVALINRQWVDIKDREGNRRLDNPQDFVRIEIAAALRRRIRVIPVLFDNTPMPRSTDLPHGLKRLASRNAVFVQHRDFHPNVNYLIKQLELALQAVEESRILKAKILQEKKAREKRQAEIENFLAQADVAIQFQGWELAKEKLEAVIVLEPEHGVAQAKLAIVEHKLQEINDQNLDEEKAKKESAEKIGRKKVQQEAAKDVTKGETENAVQTPVKPNAKEELETSKEGKPATAVKTQNKQPASKKNAVGKTNRKVAAKPASKKTGQAKAPKDATKQARRTVAKTPIRVTGKKEEKRNTEKTTPSQSAISEPMTAPNFYDERTRTEDKVERNMPEGNTKRDEAWKNGYAFISYARSDSKIVDTLITRLNKAGYLVWVDRMEMAGDEQLRQEIVDAIKNCTVFILALSHHSIRSEYVRKELDLADTADRWIVPVVLQQITDIPARLKYQLAGIRRIDLATNFELGFMQLINSLAENKPVQEFPWSEMHDKAPKRFEFLKKIIGKNKSQRDGKI